MKWGDFGGFCGFLDSGPPGGPPFGPPLGPPPFQAGPPKSKKSPSFPELSRFWEAENSIGC